MIRLLADKILSRAGFDVSLTEGSREALALFESHDGPYDLVITDYTLDGLTGIDLASAIRTQAPDLPIIMSSGDSINPDDISPDLQRNLHILQKPYRAAALIELVESALAGAYSPAN
jgi:DNA-binding NtrC family response regulator